MIILFLLFAYLIGSIPFGLVLTKIFLKEDIRAIGSGNIGATNVLRAGSKKLAFLTLLLDGLKGAAPVFFINLVFYALDHALSLSSLPFEDTRITTGLCVGLAAILGHCFPVWLKFRGGKGVATAFGVLLAAAPVAGLAACAVWLAVFFLMRISSAAALSALAVAPVVTLILYGATPAVIVLLIAALVFWRHKDNIRRLMKGQEPKFGRQKQ